MVRIFCRAQRLLCRDQRVRDPVACQNRRVRRSTKLVGDLLSPLGCEVRLLRSRKDNIEVEPPLIGSGKFHIFLSHTWAQGEDAARTIKLRLVEMMPKVAVFLDKVWRFHQAPCSCALLSDHTP